jgi:hypothetical protein
LTIGLVLAVLASSHTQVDPLSNDLQSASSVAGEAGGPGQVTPTGVRRVGTGIRLTAAADQPYVDADVAVLDSGVDVAHPDLQVAGGVDCTITG